MQHELTPKQEHAAQLLAHGNSVAVTADHLKIRRETLWRWKNIPAFQQKIASVMQEMHGGLRDRLIRLAYASLDTIEADLVRHDEEADDFEMDNNPMEKAMRILNMLGMQHFRLTPGPDTENTAQAVSNSSISQ